MSTATKKTPQKKEKDEQPRTPVRTNLVTRAVSMQTRRVTKTPEEKKQERDARKAEDTALRRKPTPRKAKKVVDKDQDTEESKQASDDKHVKWEDQEDKLESTSEGESTDDGEKQEEEIVEENHKENNTNGTSNAKVDESTVHNTQEAKQKEQIVEEHHKVTVTTIKPAEFPTTIKANEQIEADENKIYDIASQAALDRYNQLWEEENQLREKLTDRERRRRLKASGKIDKEFEKLMAEAYTKGSQSSTQTSSTSSLSMQLVDSDDEDNSNDGKLSKMEEELKRLRNSLLEKEAEVAKLQTTPNMEQVAIQLRERQLHEQREMQAQIDKLREANAKLVAQASAARLEERTEVVDKVSEALEAEAAQVEQMKAELNAREVALAEKEMQVEQRVLETQKLENAVVARRQHLEITFAQELDQAVRKRLAVLKKQQMQIEDEKRKAVSFADDSIDQDTSLDTNSTQENYANSENSNSIQNSFSEEFTYLGENDSDGSVGEAEDSLGQPSHKRRKLDDDEADANQQNEAIDAPGTEIEGDDEPNSSGELEEVRLFPKTTSQRKTLKPRTKIGLAVAATALGLGVLSIPINVVTTVSQYLPHCV